MTALSGAPLRRARRFDRRDAVGSLAVGLVHALTLSVMAALIGMHLLLSRPSLWLGENTLLVEATVLAALGWVASYAASRRFRLQRAAAVVSVSLTLTAFATAAVAFVIGEVAILIGLFSIFLVWKGDATEPLVVLAVAVTAAFAIVTGPVVALLTAFAFCRREPVAALRPGPSWMPAVGPPLI